MKLAFLRRLILGLVDLVAACSVAAFFVVFEVSRAEGHLGRALWAGHEVGRRVLGVNIIWILIAMPCGFVWLAARYAKRILASLQANHPALHSTITKYPHFIGMATVIPIVILQLIVDRMVMAALGE